MGFIGPRLKVGTHRTAFEASADYVSRMWLVSRVMNGIAMQLEYLLSRVICSTVSCSARYRLDIWTETGEMASPTPIHATI